MKRAITLALFLFFSLYFQSVLYAQLSKIIAPNQNLFSIVQNANKYFDSLRTVLGDSILEGEGSEFASYQRFFNFWAPRLSTHGDFEKYFKAFHTSISNQGNFLQANLNPWQEIGPFNKPSCNPDACYASGLGPIEHISVFKNNPQYMLCCQLRGGVFYSQDGGVSWSKTGTDTQVPLSGMGRAIFHPTDHTIWFTSSGGGTKAYPFFIMYTGGIWRASNEGASWTKIADYTNLGGIWNIIWELRIDPSNPDVLYAATENGLYKTSNANSSSPTWTQVPSLANKKVYDLEFKPQNPQILYATVKDSSGWQFMVSTNAGQTWSTIAGAPASVSSANFLTIEVSNGAPDNLYCLIGGIGQIWIYNSSTSTWNYISTTNTNFGGGYNFAVNQINGSEIFVGYNWELMKVVINGTTTIIPSAYSNPNSFHPDIEYLLCHPNNSNEVWMACHGGVYKSTDGGMTWNDRSNGLAVAEVLRMATAYTDPSHILIGTYHDGSMHTITPYSTNWTPNWKTVTGRDGQRPLIDNTDVTYMWTSGQKGVWFFSQDAGASFTSLGCGPYSCFSEWETEGVLNKINPSILYREITSSGNPEVGRSFDRGITNQVISNFANIYTNTTYRPWKLYTPTNNGNYLLVHILVKNGVWYDHHLWRTKNANDPNPANVVWEELPLPYNGWFQDVEFDEDNPDIVYLAFSSSITSSNSFTGSQMIYKMDYTNPSVIPQYSCPSGLCTDLTLNLPNTGVGNDGLVLEKGSNGGMYVATDIGVFYTNKKMLANGSGWQLFGTELPHVYPSGLEINYRINKIRIGLYGRGIWESPLACPSDYDLTLTGTSLSDFYEAQNNISSNAIINPGANVTYRAGNEIILTDGFVASEGSNFHAFIHACDHPGNSFKKTNTNNTQNKVLRTPKYNSITNAIVKKPEQTKNHLYDIYPNPANEHAHIDYTIEKKGHVVITLSNICAYKISILVDDQAHEQGNFSYILNTKELSPGIYFITLQTDNYVEIKKLVIQ